MNPAASPQHLAVMYLAYLAGSIGLTVWIARTLFKHGEVFLEDVFVHNPRMANAVNRLLVVGFYLLNLGYAFVTLQADRSEVTPVQAIETLALKLGALMIALGLLHFGNLYIFHRIRRRGQIRLAPPPVRAQVMLGVSAEHAGTGFPQHEHVR